MRPYSLQTVAEGGDATAPAMPEKRGELYFRGWNRDFTNVQRSMIVSAIYAKEMYTVRFFDIDGTLLKTEQVHYGEDAEAPEVADRDGYLFDGWSTLFDSVHADLDVYATYYALPQRDRLLLTRAYDDLPHEDNVRAWREEVYYRRTHNTVFTVDGTEYAGSRVIYGNFCDTFLLDGYGLKAWRGGWCWSAPRTRRIRANTRCAWRCTATARKSTAPRLQRTAQARALMWT